MKTTNYLVLEYQRTLRLFRKLHTRFEKRVNHKTLGELTARKRYKLVKKLEKLKQKLSVLTSRLRLAGATAALGLSALALDADAQYLPEKNRTYDRFLVNETLTGNQQNPSIAMNDAGDVVTVWVDGYGIKGRKIDQDGDDSGEFIVANGFFPTNYVREVEVAMNNDGHFAVVWEQSNDGDLSIQAEIFDGQDQSSDGQFLVEDIDDATTNQKLDIALESDGDLLVTYGDDDPSYSYEAVKLAYKRRGGSTNIQVLNASSIDSFDARYPSLDMDSDGNSIAVWVEEDYQSFYYGTKIMYQKFDEQAMSQGAPQEAVGSFGMYSGDLDHADVALSDDGDFAIAWAQYYFDYYTYAQKFSADGSPVGSQINVESSFNSFLKTPSVAMDDNGSFVVAVNESSDYDSYSRQVYLRRYRADGSFYNTIYPESGLGNTDNLSVPTLAMNARGDFAVAWSHQEAANLGEGTDQDGQAVYLSKYESESTGYPIVENNYFAEFGGTRDNATVSSNDDGDYIVAWTNEYTNEYTYYSIRGQRFHADGKKNGDEFLIYVSSDYSIYSLDIDLNNDGEFVVAWNDEEGIYKQEFDGANNPSALHTLSLDYTTQPVSVAMDEAGDFSVVAWVNTTGVDAVKINTGTTDLDIQEVNDVANNSSASIATVDVATVVDQDFVVVWEDTAYPDGLGNTTTYPSIYQRRYTSATPTSDAEIVADAQLWSYGYENPQVSANHVSGDYVIAFSDMYGADAVVYLQDGTVDIGQFQVNDDIYFDSDNQVQVDMNSNGDFVVAWEGKYNEGTYGTIIQKFDEDGDTILPEIRAFSSSVAPSGIAMGDHKSIVVGNYSNILQTIIGDPAPFDLSETYEEIVNTITSGNQTHPQVASNSAGEFVVVWQGASQQSIKAQVYDADGVKSGGEIDIIDVSGSSSYVYDPKVAMNEDGDFLVAWNSDIYLVGSFTSAQITDLAGGVIADDFDISSNGDVTDDYDVAADENGDFAVVWANYDYESSTYGYSNVLLRKFESSDGTPLSVDVPVFSTDGSTRKEIIEQIDIAINSDGDLGIVFDLDYGNDGGYGHEMHIRSYSASAILSDDIIISDYTGDISIDEAVAITADDGGDFVIAAADAVINYDTNAVFMYRYVPGSSVLSGPGVCVAYGGDIQYVDITSADQGDFIIVYEMVGNVFAARVDSGFDKVGEGYKLNELSPNYGTEPKVTSPGQGKFVAVWDDYYLDGNLGTVAIKQFYSQYPVLDSSELPAGLVVSEGTTATSFASMISDAVVSNSSLGPLEYTITVIPANGSLDLDGGPVAVPATLSELEFNDLSYTHDGSETSADSFTYEIDNGYFSTGSNTFNFIIDPVNDVPVLATQMDLDVNEGGSSSITNANLEATDDDHLASEIDFVINSLPAYGSISLSGTPLAVSGVFTQQDINDGLITYEHDGSQHDGSPVDQLRFYLRDGEGATVLNQSLNFNITFANDAPVVNNAISDVEATEDQPFTLVLDNDVFIDEETAELDLTATLADGSALPSWLIFNELSETFTGTPLDGDGTVEVRVTAEDEEGLTNSDEFTLTVIPVDDEPVVITPIPNQTAFENDEFSFTVRAGTFEDEETADLTLTATSNDDSPLPAWLSFDGTTFTGTPDDGDPNVIVKVTATDESGQSVSDEFHITVELVNDAPVVANPIADQQATEDQPFSFTVPMSTFSDEETNFLSLTATQSDDSPLPLWLRFSAGVFSGTPDHGDETLNVKVTAEDEEGLAVSDEFVLNITQINDAPIVVTELADQSVEGYDPFSITIDASVFEDEEDELILSASGLPSFVSFDASTGVLSGEAAINFDEGIYSITIIATENNADLQSVSSTFDLEIVAVLGVEEELNNGVSIYPNPVQNVLTAQIENDFLGMVEVSLIDRAGRVVLTDAFDKRSVEHQFDLDISSLSPGIYILRLANSESVLTYKVHKK